MSFKGKSSRQNGSGRKHMMGENIKRHDIILFHLKIVCNFTKRDQKDGSELALGEER